ncbi:hypothetical protein [Nocardia inohanensis]|uniref:hypothetical protein n=1 Tax=Nocardia inohanensis TaxID=209246 RepID=UPI00082B68A3|nr:hypothetical protein [Nocardia inohanensis]
MPPGRSPRIQVTGRARAGKTTVRSALSLISAEETRPLDQPGQPNPPLDADVLLYVLPGSLQPADRAVLAALPPDRTLVLLNKADTIGIHCHEAAETAETYSATVSLPVYPIIADLAARTRSGILTDADLRTLHRHRHRTDPAFTLTPDLFTHPGLAPDAPARRALLDRWGLYGIACARTALRHAPTLDARALRQILHCASGIDPVHHHLHRLYQETAARLAATE